MLLEFIRQVEGDLPQVSQVMRSHQHPITRCHSLLHTKSFHSRASHPPRPCHCVDAAWSQLSSAETNPPEQPASGSGEQEGSSLCHTAPRAGSSPDKYVMKLFLEVCSFQCWKPGDLLFAVTMRRKMRSGRGGLRPLQRGCDPASRQSSAAKNQHEMDF